MKKPPIVLNVLPKGSKLLDLLIDLGHLTEPMLQKINERLLRLPSIDHRIELDDVRRVAAEVLFEHFEELPQHSQRTLEKEWSTLFS
jgi:hypothetical protein